MSAERCGTCRHYSDNKLPTVRLGRCTNPASFRYSIGMPSTPIAYACAWHAPTLAEALRRAAEEEKS